MKTSTKWLSVRALTVFKFNDEVSLGYFSENLMRFAAITFLYFTSLRLYKVHNPISCREEGENKQMGKAWWSCERTWRIKKRISENGAREKKLKPNAVILSTAYFKAPNNTSISKKPRINNLVSTDTGKAEPGSRKKSLHLSFHIFSSFFHIIHCFIIHWIIMLAFFSLSL